VRADGRCRGEEPPAKCAIGGSSYAPLADMLTGPTALIIG
jgi:hypothetical protein